MTNAKKELLELLAQEKLTILAVDAWLRNYETLDNEPKKSVDELDFEYDSGYGLQYLFGTVYCVDPQGLPVWLERREYDGSEWWRVCRVPDFYKTHH